MKTDWVAEEQVLAADLNANFLEVIQDFLKAQHQGHSISLQVKENVNGNLNPAAFGFSDATVKLFGMSCYGSFSGNDTFPAVWEISNDFQTAFFLRLFTSFDNSTATVAGTVPIGSDYWTSNGDATAGNRIQKNGVDVTISGTTPSASPMLGHDPTASYLLVMDSTTRIRRYSGISGTTITYVDSITLDAAVNMDCGFLFDDTNNYYVCIDKTANVIRRFNSSGVTVDTTAYTVSDTTLKGIVLLNDRYYLVMAIESNPSGSGTTVGVVVDLIPMNLTR